MAGLAGRVGVHDVVTTLHREVVLIRQGEVVKIIRFVTLSDSYDYLYIVD